MNIKYMTIVELKDAVREIAARGLMTQRGDYAAQQRLIEESQPLIAELRERTGDPKWDEFYQRGEQLHQRAEQLMNTQH